MGQAGGALTGSRLRAPLNRAASLLLIALFLCCVAQPGAAGDRAAGGSRGFRKLRLFAKEPATWSVVKGGAAGRLSYHEGSGAFSFEAAGLHAGSSYALVRYADAPPKGEVLARGASDDKGRLQLHGTWRNWSGKFWLVSGEDVAGSVGSAASLRAWRPERYLFEEKVLGVPCVCPEEDT